MILRSMRWSTRTVLWQRSAIFNLPRNAYSTRKELAAGYRPRDVERHAAAFVQPSAAAASNGQPKFSLLLPPPNVTGDLHLGHALMCTVQDVIARDRRRRLGADVCWIPGTDHAGIATQVVVEKHLRSTLGLSRQQLGRERFLHEVQRWRTEKTASIRADLQRLGATADWSREYFTMDQRQSHAVREAFVRLFDDGLLYRDGQLVNWSCALESTISDIEVDTLTLTGRTAIVVPGYEQPVQFGEITELAYQICRSGTRCDDDIVVATTRPETVLGDVAVAVHPDDVRYAHLRDPGTALWHPIRNERIPLVFDEAVDRAFGTGAVKITPAHDRFDYELARRHRLPVGLAVVDERGRICDGHDERYAGRRRFDVRETILDDLAQLGRLRGRREHGMQLPVCSRSRDVVELLMRPQWFVRCAEMAQEARRAVQEGELRLVPGHYGAEWERWLGAGGRDWCVSRQLWWGHRVPAFECWLGDEEAGNRRVWVAAHDETGARAKAARQLDADAGLVNVRQDEDVLDTWFSSALLPFSACGWPNGQSVDMQRLYPHDVLVTGHDILFFWVARMVMLGQRLTGRLPFSTVLLHGIVCDANGRKMSKSLGNVIAPGQIVRGCELPRMQADLDAAEASGVLSAAECERSKRDQARMFAGGIPECGTDALRLTLCGYNVRSHFVAFDVGECHTNKLFLNKIWQATRYTLAAHERWPETHADGLDWSVMDRWMLSRLARTLQTVHTAMDAFQFHVATAALRTFFYQNLCDVYLETTKPVLGGSEDRRAAAARLAVLRTCLRTGLVELQTFAPFVCAELLKHLPERVEAYSPEWLNDRIEADVDEMLAICAAIRQLKAEHSITRKHRPIVHVSIDRPKLLRRLFADHVTDMRTLCKVDDVRLTDAPLDGLPLDRLVARSTAGPNCTFAIELGEGVVPERPTAGEPIAGLTVNEKKAQKLSDELAKLERTVANEGYRRSASERVQKLHSEKIERIRSELRSIREIVA